MKILALEFSANERSVAVAHGEGSSIEIIHVARETSRDVTSLALIDRALQQASLPASKITDIAIGLGPGSYTGIRSAIALAQGWQLGRNVQTIGISSMLCLAATAHSRGARGEFSFVIDAQRGDVYQQTFLLTDRDFAPASDLRILPAAEIAGTPNVIGPDVSKLVPNATILNPSAEHLARLIESNTPCPAEELQPIYLRAASFVKAPPPRQIV